MGSFARVQIMQIVHQCIKGFPGMADLCFLMVGDHLHDERIVDQAAGHVSIMDPVDVDFSIDPFVCCPAGLIGKLQGYPQFDQVIRMIIICIKPIGHVAICSPFQVIEHHMVTCQREQVIGQQEYGEQPFQYRRIAANVSNMKDLVYDADHSAATTLISTFTLRGSPFTATVSRAGKSP